MRKFNKIFIIILLILSIFILNGCGKDTEEIITYKIHTELQEKYLNDKYDNIILYAKGDEDLSIPNPIKLNIDGNNIEATIYLSEQEDFSQKREFKTNRIA